MDSDKAHNPAQKMLHKRSVAPVELPNRASAQPEAPGANQDLGRSGSLSARRPQSARVRSQRPNSARTSTHGRKYSLPTGAVMPGYQAPAFYPQIAQASRGVGAYTGAENRDYAPSGGLTAAWHPGVAPVPVYGNWGYDMGWAPHPAAPGGVYGVCMMNSALSRKSEKATRIVFMGDLPAGMDDSGVQELAATFGPIRGLDTSQRETSSGVFVSYYDIRHAAAAVRGLTKALAAATRTGPLDESSGGGCAYFMLPPTGVPGMENQGIITVSCTRDDIPTSELWAAFAEVGELKAVTKVPNGAGDRVVEYHDTRDAERAMTEFKARKLGVSGVKLTYTPFAGLEPAGQAIPYQQMYPMPSGYVTHAGVKPDDSGMLAGLDGAGAGPGPTMWSMGSMGMQAPAPYGWQPYPMPGSYATDCGSPVGASAAMAVSGPAVELPTGMPESVSAAYMLPQSCRTDYYSAPQYVGYPHGMPAILPYGPAGQPVAMMPTTGVYDGVIGGMHSELPNSPVHGSTGGEPHAWRPHRPVRGCGDRNYDPAQFEFSMVEARTKSVNARTTLMIRNIPNKYSQKMLLDVFDRKYSGTYDFFYLPIDFKNRCNLGYAFVNFKNPSTTAEFYKEFHSKSWEEFNSKKVCEITYARVQGRNALIEHFRNSRFPCNEPDYLPLVFEPVEEGSRGKKPSQPVMKATPVHHWTTMNYPSTAAVAAH